MSVLDDNLLEDNETVTVTLTGITSGDADISLGGTVSDTVTIADNDSAVVTIAANDDSAAEPADDGQFTVTISSPSDTDTVDQLHRQRRRHGRQRLHDPHRDRHDSRPMPRRR